MAGVVERANLLSADAAFDVCRRPKVVPVTDRHRGYGKPIAATSAKRHVAPAGGLFDGAISAPMGQNARKYHHGDIRRSVMRVQHPQGPIDILKILQTNACANDCRYCPMRAGRDFRREAFSPDELARLVDQMYRARLIEGLFLSSGVVGRGDLTMERIVATGRILRRQYGFKGYLHLKIMPGASDEAIGAALRIADRVSVNLEAPNQERLRDLAPAKDFSSELLASLAKVKSMLPQMGRRVSRTTQFVVGAGDETDRELLTTTEHLYRRLGLSRVYYSRFKPTPGTPLEDRPPASHKREHRLYQADMLIRDYGYNVAELPLGADDRLPLDTDPKLAWAQAHPSMYPIEVNTADRSSLLRVPGIGPRGATAIIEARRRSRIRSVVKLRRIGVRTEKALEWVTIDGRFAPRQLRLPSPIGQ